MKLEDAPKLIEEQKKRLMEAKRAVESLSTTVNWAPTAMKMTINIQNPEILTQLGKEIEEGIEVGVRMAANAVREALNNAMASNWGWPEGARDIIDTGNLKDSLVLTVDGDSFTIGYTAPYAALIHYGGYVRPYGNPNLEPVYIPGRPWVDAVMGQSPGAVESVDLDAILSGAIDSRIR